LPLAIKASLNEFWWRGVTKPLIGNNTHPTTMLIKKNERDIEQEWIVE